MKGVRFPKGVIVDVHHEEADALIEAGKAEVIESSEEINDADAETEAEADASANTEAEVEAEMANTEAEVEAETANTEAEVDAESDSEDKSA